MDPEAREQFQQLLAMLEQQVMNSFFQGMQQGLQQMTPQDLSNIRDMVRDLKDEGTRFVIATHEMGFARHACDKVAFLCGGRILESGSAERVFGSPETPELVRFLSKLLEWKM